MTYKVHATNINTVLNEDGSTQYVEVALAGQESETNGYASTRVRIQQADLTAPQTFDTINKTVIVNLALKLSQNFFTAEALDANKAATAPSAQASPASASAEQ